MGWLSRRCWVCLASQGPELVVPLDRLRSGAAGNTTIYVDAPIHIDKITAEVPLEEVRETIINGVVDGVWRKG